MAVLRPDGRRPRARTEGPVFAETRLCGPSDTGGARDARGSRANAAARRLSSARGMRTTVLLAITLSSCSGAAETAPISGPVATSGPAAHVDDAPPHLALD